MSLKQHNLTFPLIVIGGGGHAKVLVSTLLLQNRRVLGFVDLKTGLDSLLGVKHIGDDSTVFLHSPEEVRLVNGVGSIGSTVLRRQVCERFCTRQYVFDSVIHPSAVIAPQVEIEDGVQVMAGAVVQPGARLGTNSIVNTGACVDHDCWIEAHAHIAPGVTLSGQVHIGEGSHIGTGASVIQGIEVGAGSIVGAGAVVTSDVPPGVTVVGVPARIVHQFATR